MEDKRQINKRYLIIYTITIIFTILYSGIFLVSLLLLANSIFWIAVVYFLPIFLGSIRILFTLIPRVERKRFNFMIVNSNSFDENTKSIANKLGSSYPKNIYVIYDTNAYATEQKGEEVIAIGFPLLITMNKYEVSFVIAHELAHHFQGDVKYGENIHRVEIVFEKLMKALNNRWFFILAGPYRYIGKKLFKEIKQVSRMDEYYADFHAAEIVGKEISKTALLKLEDSDRSWRNYLARWIWMLNEYKIFVDIVENYNLFVSITYNNNDNAELKKKPAGEYDSHPSIYERIIELDNKCNNFAPIIEVKEYDLDSLSLSIHFWGLYRGESVDKTDVPIYSNSKSAVEELSIRMTSDYSSIFESITYADLSPLIDMYSKISYNLYQKTRNDVYEYEKDMIIKVLSFIIFEKAKPVNWKIGSFFIPVIITMDDEYDLYSIINSNFDNPYSRWNDMLVALGINEHEQIYINRHIEHCHVS